MNKQHQNPENNFVRINVAESVYSVGVRGNFGCAGYLARGGPRLHQQRYPKQGPIQPKEYR